MSDLRKEARRLFDVAVARANPAKALRSQLDRAPLPALEDGGRNLILAVGKAAVPMMRMALELIPGPKQALAITNAENHCDIAGARVLIGDHPVPGPNSDAAGRAVLQFLADTRPADRVVALISGGGSALMVAPADGITLADKACVNQLLLGSGLEINDMNLVRQHLSRLKGGGLLRHAIPACVQAYILSDVIGDDLRAIASGPTVTPIATQERARATLEHAGIWDQTPKAVQALLSRNTTQPAAQPASNSLIGSNRHSLQAVLAAAGNWQAQIVSDHLTGDVTDAADSIVNAAEQAPTDRPVALIFGGETTVRLTGDGLGGRNQELALRVAQLGHARLAGDWVFLSGGTDGRDGPTTAAGGLVDARTWQHIQNAGLDPAMLLARNDSHTALNSADALLVTGGTGTNVADVQLFLRRPLPGGRQT